jgi:hypothetical protein
MIRGWLKVWLPGVLFASALVLHPQMASGEIARSAVLENNVGYLRIAQVDKGLLAGIPAALNALEATNSIAGIVVDLRFANGTDTDDLNAIEQVLESQKLPLAILINTQTTGAASRLAEELREANTGLVFGASADSFQPDIAVTISANEEKQFLQDPYTVLVAGNTNVDANTNLLPFVDIDHTTEADLVREKIKDGDQEDTVDHPTEPQKPFIRDPVLARGLDFIKGVSALHLTKNQG